MKMTKTQHPACACHVFDLTLYDEKVILSHSEIRNSFVVFLCADMFCFC